MDLGLGGKGLALPLLPKQHTKQSWEILEQGVRSLQLLCSWQLPGPRGCETPHVCRHRAETFLLELSVP